MQKPTDVWVVLLADDIPAVWGVYATRASAVADIERDCFALAPGRAEDEFAQGALERYLPTDGRKRLRYHKFPGDELVLTSHTIRQ